MKPYQIVLIVLAVLIVLGVAIIPAINRRQLKKMPIDQQIRILMQQANKLIFAYSSLSLRYIRPVFCRIPF